MSITGIVSNGHGAGLVDWKMLNSNSARARSHFKWRQTKWVSLSRTRPVDFHLRCRVHLRHTNIAHSSFARDSSNLFFFYWDQSLENFRIVLPLISLHRRQENENDTPRALAPCSMYSKRVLAKSLFFRLTFATQQNRRSAWIEREEHLSSRKYNRQVTNDSPFLSLIKTQRRVFLIYILSSWARFAWNLRDDSMKRLKLYSIHQNTCPSTFKIQFQRIASACARLAFAEIKNFNIFYFNAKVL